jgi:ribosomal protein S18 acetylase RimI-like enzyme
MELPQGWEFRPMKEEDITDALEIIYSHDEDDGEWAESAYENAGVEDQYVITYNQKVAGVTGVEEAEETDGTYWISWTYMAEEHQGKGMGALMLKSLLAVLEEKNVRQLFVTLSDYVDPEDGPIYEKALKMYTSLGFTEQIVHKDYYEPGESELIYGYALRIPVPMETIDDDNRGIVFTDLFEIDETDGAYAIDWEFSNRNCTIKEMNHYLKLAKKNGARSVFISFPSNVVSGYEVLQATGFNPVGMLKNFYEDGIHEVHFRYNL